MNTTTKNLFFLLSAAPMGMGGCVVDLDPFDTSLTSFTTETGGDGDGDTGDGDGDTGDGDGDTGDGDGDTGDGDGDTGDGDGDGDGDAGDGDGDGDGDPGDPCAAFAAKYAECYGPEYADYAAIQCQEAISYNEMYYGVECGAAFEALFVCTSTLSCEDFMMEPPAGCEAEAEAINLVCVGG